MTPLRGELECVAEQVAQHLGQLEPVHPHRVCVGQCAHDTGTRPIHWYCVWERDVEHRHDFDVLAACVHRKHGDAFLHQRHRRHGFFVQLEDPRLQLLERQQIVQNLYGCRTCSVDVGQRLETLLFLRTTPCGHQMCNIGQQQAQTQTCGVHGRSTKFVRVGGEENECM